jgi:hypothetical protein
MFTTNHPGVSPPYSEVEDADCNHTWNLMKHYTLHEDGNTWECDSSITTVTPTDGRIPLNMTSSSHTACHIVDYGTIFTSMPM